MLGRNHREGGFSVLELIVVVAIIVLIASVILSRGQSSNAKARAATVTVLDTLKDVRQRSLSVRQFYTSDLFPNYGLGLDIGEPTNLRIYADCKADDNNDDLFDSTDRFTYDTSAQYPLPKADCPPPQPSGFIEDKSFPSGAKIFAIRVYNSSGTEITPAPSRAYVSYFRPEPTVWIAWLDGGGSQQVLPVGRIEIDVGDVSGTVKRTVSVSTTGRIIVQ